MAYHHSNSAENDKYDYGFLIILHVQINQSAKPFIRIKYGNEEKGTFVYRKSLKSYYHKILRKEKSLLPF